MTVRSEASGDTVRALLEAGAVTQAQLDEATRSATERGQSVIEALIDGGWVDRPTVVRTAATSAGLEYVELAEFAVDVPFTTVAHGPIPAAVAPR